MSSKDTKILSRNLTGDFHGMMVAMANFRLDEMTDEEVLALCPKDYGETVTDDHLNLVWDKLYTELEKLDEMEIINMYENYLDIINSYPDTDEEEK